MSNSKAFRTLLYTRMYTAVSSATAEKQVGKESVKTIFNGLLPDLFKGIKTTGPTIRAFMWAISHKTDALPTVLFKIVRKGKKGYEISRVHSGFYTEDRKHIFGTDLIPYIMDAVKLWEPKARSIREPEIVISEEQLHISNEIEIATTSLNDMSDDALACFGKDAQQRLDKAKSDLQEYESEVKRREEIHEKQIQIKNILDQVGMTREELLTLLGVC